MLHAMRENQRGEESVGSAMFRFYAELNDFLSPSAGGRERIFRFCTNQSVKAAIEGFGVPHTEVDLILVNGTISAALGLGLGLLEGCAVGDVEDHETRAVAVGDPGAKNVRPDDKVVIEMVRFPAHSHDGEGVIVEVLGPRGEPGVDTLSVIHQFGLPQEFPEEVLDGWITLEIETADWTPRELGLNDDARLLTGIFGDGFIGVVVDDAHQLKGVVTKLDLVDILTSPVESPA